MSWPNRNTITSFVWKKWGKALGNYDIIRAIIAIGK
jgi:hypothetical protein